MFLKIARGRFHVLIVELRALVHTMRSNALVIHKITSVIIHRRFCVALPGSKREGAGRERSEVRGHHSDVAVATALIKTDHESV